MVIWLIFAVLAAVVVGLVIWPLAAARGRTQGAGLVGCVGIYFGVYGVPKTPTRRHATSQPEVQRQHSRLSGPSFPKGRAPNHAALSACVGNANLKMAPRGSFAVAHMRPSCASMIERQIDSPIPKPPDLVV
jgi:hypothetical protein